MKDKALIEYKAARREFIKSCCVYFIIILGICTFNVYVVWSTIDVLREEKNNSLFLLFITVIVIAGCYLLYEIFLAIYHSFTEDRLQFKTARNAFRQNALAESVKSQKKESRAVTVVICFLFFAMAAGLIVNHEVKVHKLSVVYEKAEQLIDDKEYQEAYDYLKEIEDSNFKDTKALMLLCQAHIEHNANRTVRAYYTLKEAQFYYQSEEQMEKITRFKKILDHYFKSYLKAAEDNYKKANSRIEVPYIGMREDDLDRTSLGKPVKHGSATTEYVNGNVCKSQAYWFINNGIVIFTVTCTDGIVVKVHDKKNEVTTKANATGDVYIYEPEVDDFSHPEDFYYYYYDDFYDYVEAEKYYFAHGGK